MPRAKTKATTRVAPANAAASIDHPGLTIDEACRAYGPPELVAELDRLTTLDRSLPTSSRAPMRPRLSDHPAVAAGLQQEMVARSQRFAHKIGVRTRVWNHVRDMLAAGRLVLTWQPLDPAAPRQALAADRCAALQLPFMGDTGAAGYLQLDGSRLKYVRLRPVEVVPVEASIEVIEPTASGLKPPQPAVSRKLPGPIASEQIRVRAEIDEDFKKGYTPEQFWNDKQETLATRYNTSVSTIRRVQDKMMRCQDNQDS